MNIPLGFEVGTGNHVEIPLKHMAITGQTQEAGKTTALEALITRSKLRALTFVTKRGEGSFRDVHVQRSRPYFREQADWQFVASILEASRGEKLKFERAWIIRASKGARTLADVQRNVRKAMETAKGMSADVYLTLDAYLDAVVPYIGTIQWATSIELQDGITVMDLTNMNVELQHLVIKSSLDWVLQKEENAVVVIPEAWKFIPQGRGTPVKLSAESYIRQAAGLKNYLWLDSQDIGGIEKAILRSVPLWVLGVQREANEIKRTLDNIPGGIAKPKKDDVATLGLGQFFICHHTKVIKAYVQPAWLPTDLARQVAVGTLDVHAVRPPSPIRKESPTVDENEARRLRDENERLRAENRNLHARLEALEANARPVGPAPLPTVVVPAPAQAPRQPARAFTPQESFDNETLYQAFKSRLIDELPSDSRVMDIVLSKPELRVRVKRHTLEVDGSSLRGRIARLIADDFFAGARTSAQVLDELLKRGADRPSNIELGNEMKALCDMGFFTRDNKWYSLVPGMKVNVVEQ